MPQLLPQCEIYNERIADHVKNEPLCWYLPLRTRKKEYIHPNFAMDCDDTVLLFSWDRHWINLRQTEREGA